MFTASDSAGVKLAADIWLNFNGRNLKHLETQKFLDIYGYQYAHSERLLRLHGKLFQPLSNRLEELVARKFERIYPWVNNPPENVEFKFWALDLMWEFSEYGEQKQVKYNPDSHLL